MRIFFVGLTGSGKTTIGKRMAHKLSLPFVDLDHYLVEKEGKNIGQLFEEKGEAYFREMEAKYLRELCKLKDVVISTGGGAACFHDNMTVMNVSGITIFLDVPIPIITLRLWNQPNRQQRPMIANKTIEELQLFLNELYEKRVEFYKEAKLIMKGENIKTDQVLEELNNMD